MNKEELLQYFQSLDVSTLQKLKKYSELLIIPDEDMLVNVNMSQMVEKAHSLADSLFPEWTDRSKSDFGEFLVELFSLFSEKDFWYINAFANEGILSKMRSYSNAFSKAVSLGYTPKVCKSAKALFRITFEKGERAEYSRGDLSVEVDGMTFSNEYDFIVEKSSADSTKQLFLNEGKIMFEDITYNGHNIFIRKHNVDINSIRVAIDNVTYTRVNNFGESLPDSTHFMVLPEEDGSCSVYFGSDGFGVQPSLGKSIRIEYRLCDGAKGNIGAALAEPTEWLSNRRVLAANMVSSATEGTDSESLESIKQRAPIMFKNKRTAINAKTCEEIINGLPFVHKSKVMVFGSDIVFRVIPTSGFPELSEEDINKIYTELNPCLLMGYNGVYAINAYKSLRLAANPSASKIVIDAIISEGYSVDGITEGIIQVMEDLTNPLVSANYDGIFDKVSAEVHMRSRVRGIQSVSFRLKVGTEEQIMSNVQLEEGEIFRKINSDELTIRTHVI